MSQDFDEQEERSSADDVEEITDPEILIEGDGQPDESTPDEPPGAKEPDEGPDGVVSRRDTVLETARQPASAARYGRTMPPPGRATVPPPLPGRRESSPGPRPATDTDEEAAERETVPRAVAPEPSRPRDAPAPAATESGRGEGSSSPPARPARRDRPSGPPADAAKRPQRPEAPPDDERPSGRVNVPTIPGPPPTGQSRSPDSEAGTRAAALQLQVRGLREQLERQGEHGSATRSRLSLLAERLDDVRDRIEELTRDEARTATIRSLDRTAEELKARLDGLEDRVERELTAPELETARHFGTRLGDLERRVAEIHADMEGVRSLRDALEPLLAESRARLGELREGLAERDDWLRRLERALSERDRRVEVLSRTVAQRDAQLEALQADLDRRDALLERYAERLDARTPPGLEERATLHTGPGPDAPAAGVDQADDLQRIRGVGPKFERALRELGVHRYAQIAAWSDADIEAVATKLGIKPSRIHRAGWIASAKALLDADRTP